MRSVDSAMAETFAEIFAKDNPVFRAYVFYCSVLVLKMMFLSMYTGHIRMKKKVFANPEDAVGRKDAKVKFDDADVERARRAHLNDLENVVPFFVVSFLYQLTGPSVAVAVNLFRVFTAARIIHTLVYAVVPMPQPSRGLSFGVGALVIMYMAVQTVISFL